MVKWEDCGGGYHTAWVGDIRAEVIKYTAWSASYGMHRLGKFTTLKRAKAWIEEVAPLIDAGEGWESGPESERGPDWFGNDGIDYREAA